MTANNPECERCGALLADSDNSVSVYLCFRCGACYDQRMNRLQGVREFNVVEEYNDRTG
jgi:ribosomal protein S27AE